MGKPFLIAVCFLLLCCSYSNAGQNILAIQSFGVKPYELSIDGFKEICTVRVKRLILDESKDFDIIKTVKKRKPDLILAIGMNAFEVAREIRNIPVVYFMVLNPIPDIYDQENITGINMNISQEKQLKTLLNVMPKTRRVGLLYDPDRTGNMVVKAQIAAEKLGIKLVTKKVYDPKIVPLSINGLKGRIDVLWMLPDITVITPDTIEYMLIFSIENKIPILTFSEKYLESEAMLSIGIDPFDIRKQAG